MNCPRCNAEIPDKFKFCPECGTSIAAATRKSDVERDLSIGKMETQSRFAQISAGEVKTKIAEGGGEAFEAGKPLAERYELLEEIGHGGFARVWRARDKKLGRTVAVKRLLENTSSGPSGKQTLARFRREAQAIARLNHRNIVAVYDVDRDDQGDYLVMELVEGGSLREYLKAKKKLPAAEGVEIIRGVAQGLAYAHKKGLVHRDVKPANVMLEREGSGHTPKIVDFGLARSGADSELSLTGYGLGTPYYMPPEQRRDAKSVNHTADIYALGKTFYELLTGEIPDQVDPDQVPPALARLILKCVKNNPEDRYFSAEEFLADLDGGLVRRVAAVSGNTAAQAEAVNQCPSCGAANAAGVEFCETCGTGLLRNCPECGRRNSVHKAFCGACGTDVAGFLKCSEALVRIRKFNEEKRWSRIVKEAQLLPEGPASRGKNGQGLRLEISGLRKQAELNLSQLEGLSAALEQACQARDFETALKLLGEIAQLDPNRTGLAEEMAGLRVQLDEQNWQVAAKRTEAARQDRRFDDGRKALREYLDRAPATAPHVAEAREALLELACAQSEWAWQTVCADADGAVARGELASAIGALRDYVRREKERPDDGLPAKASDHLAEAERRMFELEAMRQSQAWEAACLAADAAAANGNLLMAAGIYREFMRAEPNHPKTSVAEDKENELKEKHHAQRDEETWRTGRQRVQALIGEGRLGDAISALDEFVRSNPLNRQLPAAREWIARLETELETLLESRLQEVRNLLARHDLKGALGGVDAVRLLSGSMVCPEGNKLARAVESQLAEVRQLVAQAANSADAGNWSDAVEAIDRACAMDRSDPRLPPLREAYVARLEQREAELRVVREHVKWAIGILAAAIVVLCAGVLAHQACWQIRFRHAVREKALPPAQVAHSHLMFSWQRWEKLKQLRSYAEQRDLLNGALAAAPAILGRYYSNELASVETRMGQAARTASLDAAFAHLEEARRILAGTTNSAAGLIQWQKYADGMIRNLASNNAARLLDADAWDELTNRVAAAAAAADARRSLQAYVDLRPELEAATAVVAGRKPDFDAMKTAQRAATRTMDDALGKHGAREYFAETIRVLSASNAALNDAVGDTRDYAGTAAKLVAWQSAATNVLARMDAFRKLTNDAARLRQEVKDMRVAVSFATEWADLERRWSDSKSPDKVKDPERFFGALKADYEQLRQKAQEMDEMVRTLNGRWVTAGNGLGDLSRKPYAAHAVRDRTRIQKQLDELQAALAEAKSGDLEELGRQADGIEKELGVLRGKCGEIERLLPVYRGLLANFKEDAAMIRNEAPEELQAYQQACADLVGAVAIVDYSEKLAAICDLMAGLADKADDLRRQQR